MEKQAAAPNRAFISYGSPALIYFVFYLFSNKTSFQTCLFIMWSVHFIKRLLESRYLHIYSLKPGQKVVMHGCFTSWAFIFYIVFALAIGYSVNRESYSTSNFTSFTPLLVFLYFFSILLNFIHHTKLRLLKTNRKNQQRTFPNGLGFEYVSCPHYLGECFTWLFFAIISNTLSSWLFFMSTFALLLKWSRERFLQYQKMEGYPKNRKALIPFIY